MFFRSIFDRRRRAIILLVIINTNYRKLNVIINNSVCIFLLENPKFFSAFYHGRYARITIIYNNAQAHRRRFIVLHNNYYCISCRARMRDSKRIAWACAHGIARTAAFRGHRTSRFPIIMGIMCVITHAERHGRGIRRRPGRVSGG